jgi:hypothetical protein
MKAVNLMFLGVVLVACNGGPNATPQGKGSAPEPQLGELSLSLVGSDRVGQSYRLRNADFDIDAYYLSVPIEEDAGELTHLVVSSDTDPDATSIRTRLLPGSYSVRLDNGDWFLEKVGPGGNQRVAEAVLLSERQQYAYISDNGFAEVTYRFGVDGKLIDFRHGDLNIDIAIEHPGDDGDGGVTATDGG